MKALIIFSVGLLQKCLIKEGIGKEHKHSHTRTSHKRASRNKNRFIKLPLDTQKETSICHRQTEQTASYSFALVFIQVPPRGNLRLTCQLLEQNCLLFFNVIAHQSYLIIYLTVHLHEPHKRLCEEEGWRTVICEWQKDV